jgi:hypothetical protein
MLVGGLAVFVLALAVFVLAAGHRAAIRPSVDSADQISVWGALLPVLVGLLLVRLALPTAPVLDPMAGTATSKAPYTPASRPLRYGRGYSGGSGGNGDACPSRRNVRRSRSTRLNHRHGKQGGSPPFGRP